MKSNLIPELFSQAQIDYLRKIGVRVEYYGSSQSVFNDAANIAIGRVRMFSDGIRKLLSHDESKPGPGLPPLDGTWCPQCGPDVACDEDGCCSACGATCVGEGAEQALAWRAACPWIRREDAVDGREDEA